MIKFLPLTKSILLLLFCFTTTVAVHAQSKGSKSGKENGKLKGYENISPQGDPGLPIAPGEEKSKAAKMSEDGYKFMVFINPADAIAMQIWNSLPGTYGDFKTETLNSNQYILASHNPEMALFKRAYGAYFQIFSKEDLQNYGGAIPCFGEMVPILSQVSKKISSK